MIEYDRPAKDYTGWNIYTWNSGFGSDVSVNFADINGKMVAKIPVKDSTADLSLSFCMRQRIADDEWANKENAGKTANLYRYNAEKGRLEYCGSFTVTSNGQSMFALKRGGNYLVTVTERRPSENVWFAEGNYIVKAGDTLSKIARRNHMTLTELLRRNTQITNRNLIKVGQRLNLN